MTVEPVDLNASEALIAFTAWLNGRDEAIGTDLEDSSKCAELVRAFCSVNRLPPPRDGWDEKVVRFPVEG